MSQDAKVITIITKNNVFELDNRSFRKLKPIIRNDFGMINVEIKIPPPPTIPIAPSITSLKKLGLNRYV